MIMANVLKEIIELLVGGISGMAKGLASGINEYVSDLFIATGEGSAMGLSTFGGMVAIFGGIALAVGITRRIFNWLISLGGRN